MNRNQPKNKGRERKRSNSANPRVKWEARGRSKSLSQRGILKPTGKYQRSKSQGVRGKGTEVRNNQSNYWTPFNHRPGIVVPVVEVKLRKADPDPKAIFMLMRVIVEISPGEYLSIATQDTDASIGDLVEIPRLARPRVVSSGTGVGYTGVSLQPLRAVRNMAKLASNNMGKASLAVGDKAYILKRWAQYPFRFFSAEERLERRRVMLKRTLGSWVNFFDGMVKVLDDAVETYALEAVAPVRAKRMYLHKVRYLDYFTTRQDGTKDYYIDIRLMVSMSLLKDFNYFLQEFHLEVVQQPDTSKDSIIVLSPRGGESNIIHNIEEVEVLSGQVGRVSSDREVESNRKGQLEADWRQLILADQSRRLHHLRIIPEEMAKFTREGKSKPIVALAQTGYDDFFSGQAGSGLVRPSRQELERNRWSNL